MLNQAILNTGLRFGVAYVGAEAFILLLAVMTGANPYGSLSLIGFILLPVFQIMALRYIGSFDVAQELSFGNAFRVGSMTALLAAGGSAMLLYIFTELAGERLLAAHIREMEAMMVQVKPQLEEFMGPRTIKQALEDLNKLTPGMVAYDLFLRKMIVGAFAAVILAIFFRKKS